MEVILVKVFIIFTLTTYFFIGSGGIMNNSELHKLLKVSEKEEEKQYLRKKIISNWVLTLIYSIFFIIGIYVYSFVN